MGAPSSILRSAAVVGAMTAISRVLGLVREQAMAYVFGTSALRSAFVIAFMIPNLFRGLFGEGALSSAFIPAFSKSLADDGNERAAVFASRIVSLLAVSLGVVVLAVVLLTYPAARLLPPTGTSARWLLTLPMLRIMLPYALFICVAAVLSGVLNTFGRFAVSSLTPLILNAVWIVAIIASIFLVAGPVQHAADPVSRARLLFISWAILAAGLVQIAFLLVALRHHGFRIHLAFHGVFTDPAVRHVLVLMLPAAFAIGIGQINVIVDKTLAMWADASAPAALEYAERLVYLPLGMFGTAFLTVLLPAFSRDAAAGDLAAIQTSAERAFRNLALIMAPCALALVCLAGPVIHLVYNLKGGSFDAASNLLTARALACYAPGLLFFSFQKITSSIFFSVQDMRTPVKVSLGCLVMNITLNILSVCLLPDGWKHAGIAGSTVVCSAVNGLVLAALVRRHHVVLSFRAFVPTLLRALVAAIAMCAVAVGLYDLLASCITGKLVELGVILAVIAAAMGVYFALVFVLARPELREMAGDLLSRRRRA